MAVFGLCLIAPAAVQTQRAPRNPATPPARPNAPTKKVAPEFTCPAPLGIGVKTHESFCEVLAGRDPASGIVISIPPHRGPTTLSFDLHNLQVISSEQVQSKHAFTRYTATVGLMTKDNTLVSRAIVQSEFRGLTDLVDRIVGDAGPGGVKAVAPTGTEPVSIEIPEAEQQVSILGEKVTIEGQTPTPAIFAQTGRPIAAISNVMLEYRPAPVRPGRRGEH